jgi:hypothetical protein
MPANLAEDPHAKKILGVRNYRSDKKEFCVFDFADIDVLESFLEEVSTGESDITPAGKWFLEKHYGLSNLSELLHKRGIAHRFVYHGDSAAGIEQWLRNLEPMETMAFIEETGATLNREQSCEATCFHLVRSSCWT